MELLRTLADRLTLPEQLSRARAAWSSRVVASALAMSALVGFAVYHTACQLPVSGVNAAAAAKLVYPSVYYAHYLACNPFCGRLCPDGPHPLTFQAVVAAVWVLAWRTFAYVDQSRVPSTADHTIGRRVPGLRVLAIGMPFVPFTEPLVVSAILHVHPPGWFEWLDTALRAAQVASLSIAAAGAVAALVGALVLASTRPRGQQVRQSIVPQDAAGGHGQGSAGLVLAAIPLVGYVELAGVVTMCAHGLERVYWPNMALLALQLTAYVCIAYMCSAVVSRPWLAGALCLALCGLSIFGASALAFAWGPSGSLDHPMAALGAPGPWGAHALALLGPYDAAWCALCVAVGRAYVRRGPRPRT